MEAAQPRAKVSATTTTAAADEPLYTDWRAIGAEFWIAVVVGSALALGVTLGATALVTLFSHGFEPLTQICECPSNHETFGSDAVFYDDCNERNSSWFQKYNASPQNTTFSAKGWFGSKDWTRKTLRTQLNSFAPVASDPKPFVYECPVFVPFWHAPIDYVGVALTVIGILSATFSIASGTVRKTEVFADRVQVTWFGGERTAVPLCALQGEPAKHEWAGMPPAREGALVLKTTETVTYKGSSSNATSERLKEGTYKSPKEVRAEPKDKDAFLAALGAARAEAPKRECFFSDELPALPSLESAAEYGAQDDADTSYVPRHTAGFWLRCVPVLVVYWAVLEFGFKIFLFAIQELVQPGRPKQEDEFRKEMLAIGDASVVFAALVAIFGPAEKYNSLPSRVTVRAGALVVSFARGFRDLSKWCGSAAESEASVRPSVLVVPTAAVTAATLDIDCCEKAIRFAFDELGGVYVKAAAYFVCTDFKKKVVVKKFAAKDATQGREVTFQDFSCFYPPDERSFAESLHNSAGAPMAPA